MSDSVTKGEPSLTSDNVSTKHTDVNSLPLYAAGMAVWKTGSPLSIALGTFGNIMVFIVLCEKNGTMSSMSVYFMVLAVSDLIGIYFNLVPRWIKFHFNVDIKAVHDVVCKLCFWIPYSSSTMSTWTLVVMVTQRTISVIWHHKINGVSVKTSATLIVSLVAAFSVTLNVVFLFSTSVVTMTVQNVTVMTSCNFNYDDDFTVAVYNVWFWINTVTSSCLPFVILLADNVVLIRHVTQATRDARLRLAVGSLQQVKVREKKATSMTVTLIATSVLFFVMTFPYYTVEAVVFLVSGTLFSDMAMFELFAFLWSFFAFVWCSHHAVNFYLYCLTGTRFRARASALLFGCRKSGSTGRKSISAGADSSSEQQMKASDIDSNEDF